jgi:K(+)-stimulated pyrophosphate-energized sodium pump
VLAATALFGSFTDAVTAGTAQGGDGSKSPAEDIASSFNLEIVSPNTSSALLLGASVVFLFSGLAINAVTRAAGAIIFEVRRQFREIPGIMEGTEKPEYGKVVDICTRDSLRELATPGLLAALTPIAVGLRPRVSVRLPASSPGRSRPALLMAVFLANSGGAWDNAKKIVEDGAHGGKGSEAHAATVIGDTVGDPFKDTAGPAINPLIKVMNLVSVLIARPLSWREPAIPETANFVRVLMPDLRTYMSEQIRTNGGTNSSAYLPLSCGRPPTRLVAPGVRESGAL